MKFSQATSGQGSDSARVPEVHSAISSLGHNIDALQDRFELLLGRLQPVLSTSTDIKSEPSVKPAPYESSLADSIRTETNRVDSLCAQVSEILSRLEI